MKIGRLGGSRLPREKLISEDDPECLGGSAAAGSILVLQAIAVVVIFDVFMGLVVSKSVPVLSKHVALSGEFDHIPRLRAAAAF